MNAESVRTTLERSGYDAEAIDRFLAYHNSHPAVWKQFQAATNNLLAKNKKKIGAKAIAEFLRWMWDAEPRLKGAEMHYAINNNYTALYVRVFVAKYPQHRDRFELRMPAGLRQAVQTNLELRAN